ncbi:MAG: macro domain-containing protein [Clostridia bacterium]|nr:macro domain-containing protein [Clostridia bacterium]
MPYQIIRQDITKMNADAIVNAANTELAPGGGVCGAIFAAAGYDELCAECERIGHCDTGNAVITKGYALPAKYIIHTPGPVYRRERADNAELLYSCYRSSLELAKMHRLTSIAFPLISSGIYGYPADEALAVATQAISDFLEKNDMDVYLVVYDKKTFKISSELFDDVKEYIDARLVKEQDLSARAISEKLFHRELRADNEGQMYPQAAYAPEPPTAKKPKHIFGKKQKSELDRMLLEIDSSFSEYLLYLIDESGMTDVQVYKKANVDRKLFSKIRSNPAYKPSKLTAVAFAVALELDWKKACDLVGRAGYSFSHSSKFDIIIEYFINNGNYDIFEINEVLFAFDQPLIGC